MKYTLVSLIIDGDVIEFDDAEELVDYLQEYEQHELEHLLVSEWSEGLTILEQKFISSEKAHQWMAHYDT